MMNDKDDILIIEDSPAIGLILKKYLEELGYTRIHTCDTGGSAITTFHDLISQNKQPLVLLDYTLPDMDARSILTQILQMQPNTRVILETATEKEDEGIKELIRLGVYQYIEKPIRFENLRDIIQTMEQEQSFFSKESEQIQLLKEAEVEAEQEIITKIDFLLRSHKQISYNMIVQLIGINDDNVLNHIKELESTGKIVQLDDKREICCNQCDSVKIVQTYSCPTCNKNNFNIAKLIEHFSCGNFSEEKTYVDNLCPKCNKEIKAVGVDYKIIAGRYICNSCSDIFAELSTTFLCLKCESRFTINDAKWKTGPYYKAIKL
ncbi:MAG: response regulator [Nitrosopumilus sp.]